MVELNSKTAVQPRCTSQADMCCGCQFGMLLQVADFGLAEWLQPDGKAAVPLVTNRCWVAPEVPEPQVGPYTVSRASQVYMFGMLMYEVLTGKTPYLDELVKLPPPQMQMVSAADYKLAS